jgi:outer membrane lipoprotein SlyB
METKIITILMIGIVSFGLIFSVGCENEAQTGAVLGALTGAGIGQLAGRNTESTLIGAAVGGTAGYMLGNEGDKHKARDERQRLHNEVNTVYVKLTNSNGSIVRVPLRKYGVGYLGTRGEYYPTLPSGDQLRPIYGF